MAKAPLTSLAAALLLAAALPASGQPELVSPDAQAFRVDGFAELQVRALSDGFHASRAYASQWAWVLNLEPEWDIAPEGWGPFDMVSAFARIETRYECVWTGCGVGRTWRHFGDRATRAPARNWADAPTETFVGGIDLGEVGVPVRRVHETELELLDISHVPRFERFFDVGIDPAGLLETLGPLSKDVFAFKEFSGPREALAFPLGPWNPSSRIRPNGALAFQESTTLPLPLRPASDSLFTPSAALRSKLPDFDDFDQNFRQSELEWNHGASQDEWEVKEAYLDLEAFDGRLWIRAGKQNIVWGKTELFRTTDQFNPLDIGLASLPSFEESRIALWSLRGTWSFYDVGPLEDVRLELAVNLDDFEPVDTGRCGEPYTVWLICAKSTGLWTHGVTGSGIAGETQPDEPWNDSSGLEVGARLEFRLGSFSVALMDFYGYDDVPSVELFNSFERKVDVETGRPLDVLGRPLTESNALDFHPANRQGFDFGCRASRGFGENALIALSGGSGLIPDVSERCIGDIVNVQEPLTIEAELPFPGVPPLIIVAAPTNAIGAILAGQDGGNLLLEGALNGIDAAITALLSGTLEERLAPLNRDPGDGPSGGGTFGTDCDLGVLCPLFNTANVSRYLSDAQEALLGCGPFYSTDCDVDGIDLFNAEGSVLVQAFPGFESNPVATRFVDGQLVVLPGARSTDDPDYDPSVDGTPPPGFDSEMAALSANLAITLGILGIAEGDDECDIEDLVTCAAVRAVIGLTGSQRPEVRAGGNGRYGRRDFSWHGGGEARIIYPKRNVMGLSLDFAEDRTKSNWGLDFTWIDDASFASNRSANLLQEADSFNLTLSVDRPTFVNFLNANRTFFLNGQVFFRYVPDHDGSFDTNGPLTALATLAIATGYFQDRLLPATVFVHDVSSASGGVIAQVTYRASEVFSITVGALGFYGGPERNRIPLHSIQLFDTQTSFNLRSRYEGLSPIAERDELFLQLRYTF